MAKKIFTKTMLVDVLCEAAGNLLISFATYNIAAAEGFAIAGFSGVALILYRLFGIKMGTTIFVLNIPLAIICAKIIGIRFLAKSIRCILIQSLMMNYLMPLLPVVTAERMIASIMVGVLFGVSYAIIYMRGSSTGGIDFLIMLAKRKNPHLKTGTISFALDIVTLAAYGIVFRDYESVIYGILIVFISSQVIDRIILGRNSGAVAYIVTEGGNGKKICELIDSVCKRGSTILEGKGGYNNTPKEVVMVVGSHKDMYAIQSALRKSEPEAFVIVMDSKEVQGQGFTIAKVAGDE